jgi:2-phosphoglycerate kinase
MTMLYNANKDLNIDITKSDIHVSHLLEPYLEGLIEALVESKNDYLIEGVHVQPAFAHKLMLKFQNKLRILFLGYKNIDPYLKSIQLKEHVNMIDNPWIRHMNDDELLEFTKYFQRESGKLYEACQKYNQAYFDVEDITIDKREIINTLFET